MHEYAILRLQCWTERKDIKHPKFCLCISTSNLRDAPTVEFRREKKNTLHLKRVKNKPEMDQTQNECEV